MLFRSPDWYSRFRNNWYDGRPKQSQIDENGLSLYILDAKKVPSWDIGLIETDLFMAADSGGFYWAWKKLADSSTGRTTGQRYILRLADMGFSQTHIDEVTYNINGGWNGRDIRRLTGPFAWAALNDVPPASGSERQLP